MITSRALVVGVPYMEVSGAQWDAMHAAYQYGLDNGVSVDYVAITG